MQTNIQEIQRLLNLNPVDALAIQQLQAENARHLMVIRSASNLIDAAPRYQARPETSRVLNQFMPRASVVR